MAIPDFINETATAVTSCDGLIFVLTTLSPTPGKGEDHGFVQRQQTRVQR